MPRSKRTRRRRFVPRSETLVRPKRGASRQDAPASSRVAARRPGRRRPSSPPRRLRLAADSGAYAVRGSPATGTFSEPVERAMRKRRRLDELETARAEAEPLVAEAKKVRAARQRARATRSEQSAAWDARIVAAHANLERERQAGPPRRLSLRRQAGRVRDLLEEDAEGDARLPSVDRIRKVLAGQ
jgi:hypothetical protein